MIPAGVTTTTVRVLVMSDDIVEGDEMFSMSLNVSSSLGTGIVDGSVTSATGIIIDSTSKSFLQLTMHNNCHINHSHNSNIQPNTIHWFRRCRICTGNIGTSWRNIQ